MEATSLSSTFWATEITILVLIVVLCLVIYALRENTLAIGRLRERIGNEDGTGEENEYFNGEQAEKWFEKGEIKQLNRYCARFIESSPNSVHANWYYALGHYNQGDYEIAREYFENVIRINPLWRDGAIVYLQEIADKIGPNHNDGITLH